MVKTANNIKKASGLSLAFLEITLSAKLGQISNYISRRNARALPHI